ncbi:hypothetical protein [Neobacillus sp. 19]|uniref:hypothetical protein n=1 Tax=Neobacillus sp. 19 TaxID=3394458 RepID=UPI003BF757D4
MVFLWGKDFDLSQTLNIDAVNVKTGETQHLDKTSLSSGLYGADAHALTNFATLDQPGFWNLEFTLYNTKGEKKNAGEFTIYVKEPYITIGNSTLMISQEDLYAGFYEETDIEIEGDDLPQEIELEIFSLETGETSTFTFKDKTDYTKTDGKNISTYKGDFQLKKSGKYRFTVLQQSQTVEVRKPISN